MITTNIHAAAFVLPAFAAAGAMAAALRAVMGTKVADISPKSVDRQVVWFGTGLRSTAVTSYVPQSRGSTG
jgi:hypothetical protein